MFYCYIPYSLFLSLRPLREGVAPVRGEEGGEEEDHGLHVHCAILTLTLTRY